MATSSHTPERYVHEIRIAENDKKYLRKELEKAEEKLHKLRKLLEDEKQINQDLQNEILILNEGKPQMFFFFLFQ